MKTLILLLTFFSLTAFAQQTDDEEITVEEASEEIDLRQEEVQLEEDGYDPSLEEMNDDELNKQEEESDY